MKFSINIIIDQANSFRDYKIIPNRKIITLVNNNLHLRNPIVIKPFIKSRQTANGGNLNKLLRGLSLTTSRWYMTKLNIRELVGKGKPPGRGNNKKKFNG